MRAGQGRAGAIPGFPSRRRTRPSWGPGRQWPRVCVCRRRGSRWKRAPILFGRDGREGLDRGGGQDGWTIRGPRGPSAAALADNRRRWRRFGRTWMPRFRISSANVEPFPPLPPLLPLLPFRPLPPSHHDNPAATNGRRRIRRPVAAQIAFATAGQSAATRFRRTPSAARGWGRCAPRSPARRAGAAAGNPRTCSGSYRCRS